MSKEQSDYDNFKIINELFGGSIQSTKQIENVDVVSTTSPALDRAIGAGGWPRGRLIHLAGEPSSGKSLLSLAAIAEWQRQDPENCAAFIDAEYTYDHHWAQSIGVDNSRVMLIKTNSAMHIFSGLIGRTSVNQTTKKVKKIPGILDMVQEQRVISFTDPVTGEENRFNLAKLGVIVLDSIASVNTPVEEVSEIGKQNIALMGRFLSTELKKLTPLLASSNVAMIAINQVRANPGQLFGNPTTTSGGYALKHACSLMVMLAPRSSKESKIFNEREVQIGTTVMAKVDKNKVGKPFRKAEYQIEFDKGVVNREEEILLIGEEAGIVVRPNLRSYTINGETLTSRGAALEYVKNNFDDLHSQIREAYLRNPDLQVPASLELEEEGDIEENPFLGSL
jgi:recombination protein RecA